MSKTVTIDDKLHQALKIIAKEYDTTITAFVRAALDDLIERKHQLKMQHDQKAAI